MTLIEMEREINKFPDSHLKVFEENVSRTSRSERDVKQIRSMKITGKNSLCREILKKVPEVCREDVYAKVIDLVLEKRYIINLNDYKSIILILTL